VPRSKKKRQGYRPILPHATTTNENENKATIVTIFRSFFFAYKTRCNVLTHTRAVQKGRIEHGEGKQGDDPDFVRRQRQRRRRRRQRRVRAPAADAEARRTASSPARASPRRIRNHGTGDSRAGHSLFLLLLLLLLRRDTALRFVRAVVVVVVPVVCAVANAVVVVLLLLRGSSTSRSSSWCFRSAIPSSTKATEHAPTRLTVTRSWATMGRATLRYELDVLLLQEKSEQ